MPRTLTPHGVRGSEARPRSPGEVDPDARPVPPYPPTGAVPRPRRSSASARTGGPPTDIRASGRHPAAEPYTETVGSRTSGGHRAVDRARPEGDPSHLTGGHRAVDRSHPGGAYRAVDRVDGDPSHLTGGHRAVDRSHLSGADRAVDRVDGDRLHPTGGHRAVDRSHPGGAYRAVDRPERGRSDRSGGHPAARHPQPVDDRFRPSGPLPAVAPSRPGLPPDSGPGALARVGLHLGLAAVPLLAISAQVFGVLEMRTALAWLIVPAVIVVAGLAMFAPHPVDRILTAGLLWGVVGCVLYDLFRLDTVYVLGWWGDFIPSMGSWVSGGAPGGWDGAVVGYLWRYVGDGGGIGITFFALAAAIGLDRRSRRDAVLTAVAFAVFPVWAGLIGTVALAPRGQDMLFPLTPVTVTLSLIGHLIFGVVLGLGFHRSRHVVSGWPWPPLELPRRSAARHSPAGPPAGGGQPARRRSIPSSR